MEIGRIFLNFALMGSGWVLLVLVLLSIVSVAIIFERIWYFNKTQIDFAQFTAKLTELLRQKQLSEALALCSHSSAVEAQVAAKGLERRDVSATAAQEMMSSFLVGERQNMDRGLMILGTLGNNAPFIGLFGTVLGIIEAFDRLSNNPAGGPSVVMSSISEALVSTGVGLMVAIPAVIAFNFFNRTVRRRYANAESIMKLVTSQLYS